MALLRRQGVRVIIFLDDMLMMAQSREQLITQTNAVIKLLRFYLLGFVLNFILEPRQVIPHLGFAFHRRKYVRSFRIANRADDGHHTGSDTCTLCYRNLQRLKKSFSELYGKCDFGKIQLQSWNGGPNPERDNGDGCIPVGTRSGFRLS